MPGNNPSSIIMKMAGGGVLGLGALALLIYSGGTAAAAAGDVKLAGVDCAASPEVVEIKNFGTDEQDLAGWSLRSDPGETFDLTPVGTLPAGGSVFIESGPGAQATFTWSQSQVFRDNDPADYARLVDNAGQTKGEIACAQATAAPTASPAPTATPAPGLIPNGGGPPGTPDELLSPLTLIYAGGSVIGAMAGLAVTWMGIGLGLEQRRKRRSASQEAPEASAPVAPAVTPPAPPVAAPRATRGRGRRASAQPLLLALVVALAAAVLVAFLLQSEAASKRR